MSIVSNIMIHRIDLKIDKDSAVFPVRNAQIEAVLGSGPQCRVSVVQGIDVLSGAHVPYKKIPHGTLVYVEMTYQRSTGDATYGPVEKRILMGGLLMEDSVDLAMHASALRAGSSYRIMSRIAQADAIPPSNLYFATQTNGNQQPLARSAVGLIGGGLSQALQLEQGIDKPAEVNIAEAVAKLLDYIGTVKTSVAAKIKMQDMVDTTTCPPMRVSHIETWPFVQFIERDMVQIIQQQTYLATFTALMQQFYLAVVPSFDKEKADYMPGERVKIVPLMAWYRKASKHFGLDEILSMSSVTTGKGYREVDTVAVKYTVAPMKSNAGEFDDLLGTEVCAETVDEKGKPKLVTDVQELRKLGAIGSVQMMPLPAFVSYGMADVVSDTDERKATEDDADGKPAGVTVVDTIVHEKGWARRWAKILAKTIYAANNRANHTLSVAVPLATILDSRKYLGDVVSVSVPFAADNGMLVEDEKTTQKRYGLFHSWRLSIELGDTTLNVSASISVISVREEEDNELLGIDDNPMYDTRRRQ